LAQRAASLRAILANLRLLLDSKVPSDGYIEDLFPFDLRDDKAVEAARKDLTEDIAAWKKRLEDLKAVSDAGIDAEGSAKEGAEGATGARAASAPDARTVDAAVDATDGDTDVEPPVDDRTVLGLEVEVAEARLAFLDLPLSQRRLLLDQDAERKRVALEKERANAEREKALAEQKRAEAARQKALAEAERARDEMERVVANEHARMEGARGAQAIFRRELAERRQTWAAQASAQQERVNALIDRAAKVAPASQDANALYDHIVTELAALRGQVREGLGAYRQAPSAARYTPDATFDAVRAKLAEKERSAVEASVRDLSESAADLERQARSLAWDTLEASVSKERALNAKRVELLDVISPAKRGDVLGFGPEGIAQLRRELDRMVLEGAWYRAHGEVRVRGLKDLSSNPFWIGQVTWTALLLLGVLGAVIYVRRRGPAALESLRVGIVRSIRRPSLARPVAAIIDSLVAVLPPLVFLLGVLGAERALGETAKLVEFSVPLRLMLWYASYRLFIVASHRLLYRAISRGAKQGPLGTASRRSGLVAGSVRMVARYGFSVAITLIVAAEVLGKGYLYHLVLRFAWLGAFPIFFVLVRRWRGDIADAYLAHRSQGRLADLVRSTRDRWYGFFVAVAAFAVVLGQVSLRAARRFVLGFEQTRKALAFLFRRRLEKQAAEVTAAPTEDQLPDDLRAWFSEDPVAKETYAITDVSGMDRFETQRDRWVQGKKSTALIVVGETGFGKTSWLNAAEARANGPVRRVTLGRRIVREDDFLAFVVRELALDTSEPATRSTVTDAIAKAERQLILVDDAHHLTLRGVGTLGAWDAFSEIVERTRHNTLWVAAMNGFAFQHLAWTRGGVEPFREIVHLRSWSEARVALLLDSRSRESGYEMVYDDLVVDKLEGVEGEAQLVSTQEGYARLIWDYADGCPRVALHCWKNSLVPDGPKRVRVRLFRRPKADELEALDDTERFVLASVVWHGSLTRGEAVTSLNLSLAVCEDAFDKLHDQGVIEEREGRFRVVTRWLCPVLRFLRRKHLIED
jgi:flagellar biosynthesis GTPase FlhF